MNALARNALYVADSLIYGFSYGALQSLIRQSEPLDPEATWNLITRTLPPIVDWLRLNYPPPFARRLLLAAKLKQDHLLGISQHYDVSNDFYKLFLDSKYMFYSCADFQRTDESLEDAQSNKANFLLKLIDPKSGERILDLGCGWGAMLKRIYEQTGDQENLCGYTLSQEQVVYNDRQHGFDVEFKNFITCTYPQGVFDKIFSIGAWEHVRRADLPAVTAKLFKALKPGGRMVKHFFCGLSKGIPVAAVAGQLFFPGSLILDYETHVKTFEQAGFRITHRSIHDYRPTLRAWFDNLARHRDQAIDLVGVPTYNKFIVFFPTSWRYFDDGEAMLVRWVLEKDP